MSSMLSARELLRPGDQEQTQVTRATANGFYAEADTAGQLRHFGLYRDGEPVRDAIDHPRSRWR